jgi:hypothetical protein
MKKVSYLGYVFAAIVGMLFGQSAASAAGTVILEGSDAIEFHCAEEGLSGACTYAGQVWKALDGSSKLPIAVIEGNSPVALASYGSGITVDNFTSVAAALAAGGGSLKGYAALYFEGDDGDNEGPEGDTAISAAGAVSAVQSYLGGGGTVMIEDYGGGAAFAPIVGTSGTTGINNGNCSDGETVTATGTANGFTQPPTLGCWEHQGYQESVFAPLGFTLSFFDAAPDEGGAGWSGLLSTGVTLSAPTPEPTTLTLLGLGLAAAGLLGRKRMRG